MRAADTVGLPVVLKGISPQVTHRAAAGLLAMDLRTHAKIVAAFRQRVARARDGEEMLGVATAADFIARFSRLALGAPWRRFVFEVNPVRWSRAGAVAVDGLLVVERA